MKCISFRIRTKDYKRYIYCTQLKKEIKISECKGCKHKQYKQFKELKKKSSKQRKMESKRFSILTNNLKYCYICQKREKDDLHEVFSGCNRKTSMLWGTVIPICRICHNEWDINEKLREEIQIKTQELFEKEHGHELFMTEFKIDYRERWRIRNV